MNPPSTNSTQTIQISVKYLEKAKRAAAEADSARILIPALESQINALNDSLNLERKKSALLQGLVDVQNQQLTNYKDVIVPNLEKEKLILVNRNVRLERSNKRLRKIGVILGAAVGGLVYVVAH